MRHNSLLMVFAAIVAGSGCDDSPEADMTPNMAPIVNRDAEATEFVDWQPTAEQLASMKSIKTACTGDLSMLLDHSKWSGHRLRVTGRKSGSIVTQNIGPWHIILIPTADESVVEIKGRLFSKGFTVKLDMNRDVLIIKDMEFKGSPIKGKSPMFQNTPFQGVAFKRELGLVNGSASILFLEDGRLSMDFHKVVVNGTRAGEYGVLEPSGSSE